MSMTPERVNQGAPNTAANAWPVSIPAPPTIVEKQDQTALVQTTWTSATSVNTTTATYACTGYGTANVGVTVPTTCTAGAVTVEVSQDGGTTWVPAPAVRQDNGSWENPILLPYFPGTNGSRIYAVSVDAFTHIRAKLTTVIVGTGNTVISITAVAGGIEPFVTQRSRKIPTYRANCSTAARPYRLGNVFTANTRKQFATIHHAAASTKTVKLRHCWVAVVTNSVASNLVFDLVRITTAPVTGNPAITPGKMDTSDAAAEATVLALPTTAATETDVLSRVDWLLGVTGAATTVNPAPPLTYVDLCNPPTPGALDDEARPMTIRAGVLEGLAVTVDADAATTMSAFILMEFTEEAP